MSLDIRDALVDSVRRASASFGDVGLRAHVASGATIDEGLWKSVLDLGLHGLAVPEERGGQGGAYEDLAAALEVLGGVLAPVPLWSTSTALALLVECGTEAAGKLLGDALENGSRVVAHLGDGLVAEADDFHVVVSGRSEYIADLAVADVVLARVDLGAGEAIVVLDLEAADVVLTAHRSLDLTRTIGSVELNNVPALLLASGSAATSAVARAREVAAVLLAAEQIGGARAVLDIAVEYAKTRHQFGRAIGSFQAIKHRCADMFVAVENGRSLLGAAAQSLDAGDISERAVLASAVKVFCSDALVKCAEDAIQILGGIGFTFEHVGHLYLRRARSAEAQAGTPAEHRAILADLQVPRTLEVSA